MMRWPWQPRTEDRQSCWRIYRHNHLGADRGAGGWHDAASDRRRLRLEAVAGSLSRAFADARVDGPADVAEAAITPRTLGANRPRPGARRRILARHSLHERPVAVDPRVRLGIGKATRTRRTWLCDLLPPTGPSGSVNMARAAMDSVVYVAWGSLRPRGRTMGCRLQAGRPTRRGSWQTPSAVLPTRRADPWHSYCQSLKTAATATLTPTRWPGSRTDIKGRGRARRCWSRRQAAGWGEGKPLQRAARPIGSNNGSGRCRPKVDGETCRESAFARSAWRRRVASPALWSDADQERHQARGAEAIAYDASCARLPGCCRPS